MPTGILGEIPELVVTDGVPVELEEMRSGLFLILYTISNALLLASCAVYIAATRELDKEEDNALVLPQIVAVIPGKHFSPLSINLL